MLDEPNRKPAQFPVTLDGRFPVNYKRTGTKIGEAESRIVERLLVGPIQGAVADLHISLACFDEALEAASPLVAEPAGYPMMITRSRLPVLWARGFLLALDLLRSCLDQIVGATGCGVEEYQPFEDAWPSLRLLRNTASHLEERVVERESHSSAVGVNVYGGLGGPEAILAPRVDFLDSVDSDRRLYMGRLRDGSPGVLSITELTLQHAVANLQLLLDSFEWTGHHIVFPVFVPYPG